MKKLIALVTALAVLSGMSGCSSAGRAVESSAAASPVYPKSIAFEDFDGQRSVRQDNKMEDSFSNALKDFSYKSASKILMSQTKNTAYSPVSLYMALSLAGSGAAGSTQQEILSVLGVEDKKADYISEQNGRLFRSLYSDNEIGRLKIANSLWLNKGTSFKKSFLDGAVNNFYASLYNIDFSDKKSSKLMSDWISKNTNGTFSPEINFEKYQIMSILNTIYYKDQWIDKFDEKATKADVFYLKNGQEVKCDFMNSSYVTHSFIRGEGYTSSALGLKNSGSMIFILPDKGVRIDNLLQAPEKAAKLFEEENIINGKVIFQIPKFSFGSSLSLKEALNSLGIKGAFADNADFSGITEGTAFISDINQESHIAIDEKGVEAAAFTKLDYAGSAPPKDEKAEMILNRPFIFAIKARTGHILFVGIVNNPKE
jgi:serine protease inhibitor